ncbi:Epoxide hydrolase 2, partial [Glycine soja]
ISFAYVEVKGLKLHVVEIGSGQKALVFLHGFPEIWYTWRHKMIVAANAGYRTIAFDFRGYGLSQHHAKPQKANLLDLVDDVVGLLDSLGITKDFGAFPAYIVVALHLDKVDSVIMLGFPFMLPGPSAIQNLPKGSYVIKCQEAGRVEADFVCFDVKSVIRNIYTLFSGSEIPIAGDNQEIMDLYDPTTPLPPWFSEEDLATYESLYKKSGFRFALQVLYRSSSPSMKDIEAYSAINTAKLDEAELAKSVPHNICLEVPFQV